MATLEAFGSINMDDTTFVYNDDQSVFSANDLFIRNTDRTLRLEFNGNNIVSDLVNGTTRVVTNGTLNAVRYFDHDVPIFQSLDLPNVSAVTVWNAFQLGDNNALFGTLLIGNDTLTGSGENDTMSGYDGDDLVKGQDGADRLTGRNGDDTLRGVGGKDRLSGGDGQDRLEGGGGKDTLTGGERADKFIFNTAPGGDTITDFQADRDEILLDNDALTALGATGDLGGLRFAAGTDIDSMNGGMGITTDDRILYDRNSGELYYDENGSDPGGRVLLAVLVDGQGVPAPQVTAADFVVI